MHTTAVLGSLALVLLSPPSALGQDRTWEWPWGMHPMMLMWGTGGLLMMLTMLVFWGLVIAGLVIGLRWLIGQGRPASRDEALEILLQRYARGEIDKQEFDTRRRDLGH
jgi:putative membrane protein